MADDEETDVPAEGDEIPEGAADAGDDVPEEADDEEAEGDAIPEEAEAEGDDSEEADDAPEATADEEDDDDETAGAEAENPDAEAAEDEGDEVPEEATDDEAETAEDEGDEIPEEAVEADDEDAETADVADEDAEGEEELEEIETAMAGEGEEDEEEPPSQPTVDTDGRFYGTGRRKEAVARVWVEAGSGNITVNGNDLGTYFSNRAKWTEAVRGPLECLDMEDAIDVWATADGGGLTGQADAIELGLARALVDMDENARHWLRPEGHLTRDDREVERKKINQPGARAKSQVSKR